MVNSDLDNPAGRLASILESFRKIGPDASAIEAWSKVLHVEDIRGLLVRFAELSALVETVREKVASLPEEEDPEFFLSKLKPLDRMVSAFTKVAGQKKSHYDSFVTPEVLLGVHTCSRMLRRAGLTEPTIDDSNLQSLLTDIREWIDLVVGDPLIPAKDKVFILDRLRDVESALLAFFLRGFHGVETAVATVAGSVIICESAQHRSFFEGAVRFWRRLRSVAENARTISSATTSTTKAIEAISQIVD